MHFQDVWYDADDSLIMEKIISACPVLEDLTFIMTYDHEHEFQLSLTVRSQSLKGFWFQNSIDGAAFKVEIDAPRLECLCLIDSVSDVIVVKHLSALLKIYVASDFNTEYGASLGPEDARKRYIISDVYVDSGTAALMCMRNTETGFVQYAEETPAPASRARYAPEDPNLPWPWIGLVDTISGDLYFWNTQTGVTQYQRPPSNYINGLF
ncbi:unnamed protein product [Microthlaspi erraticum]|uniref:WW domain-containing protein n=1 Tax=Microthlaspi erraticum TaxID=1685480 RepID=A0A6D2LFY7_9BRAS|nr:unnamed protein product [Microthlaspi erraticum]